MISKSKKILLLGASALAVMTASEQAFATFTNVDSGTGANGLVTSAKVAGSASGASGDGLTVGASGSVTDTTPGIAVTAAAGHTNLQIKVLSTAAAGGITAGTGNFQAIDGATNTNSSISVIENSKLITADGTAATIDIAGATVSATYTNNSGATISNTLAGAGIAFKVVDAAGKIQTSTLTNAGTISTANNAAAKAVIISLTQAASTFGITNSGTITAGAATNAALDFSGSSSGAITVTNSGTITGTTTGAAGKLTITNTGTITGNVTLGANAASALTNTAGTITGNVVMNSATQSFTLAGGTVTGNVDGLGAVSVTENATITNGGMGGTTATSSVSVAAGKTLTIAGTSANYKTAATTLNTGSTLAFTGSANVAAAGTINGAGTVSVALSDNTKTVTSTGVFGGTTALTAVNVTAGTLAMGANNLTAGAITVTGTGAGLSVSTGTLSDVTVGSGAKITISDNASVLIKASADNVGTVDVNGGNFKTASAKNIGSATAALQTLTVSTAHTFTVDSASVFAKSIDLAAGAAANLTIQNSGIVTGNVKVQNAASTLTIAAGTLTGNVAFTADANVAINNASSKLTGTVTTNTTNTGTVTISENFTTAGAMGEVGKLLKLVSITGGKTVTAGHNLLATTVRFNAATDTLTTNAHNLAIGALAGNAAGDGIFNVNHRFWNTTDGTATGTGVAYGATRLGAINVNNGGTFNVMANVDANNINIKQGGTLAAGANFTVANGILTVDNGGTLDLGTRTVTLSGTTVNPINGAVKMTVTGAGGTTTTPTDNVGRLVATASGVSLGATSTISIDAGNVAVADGAVYRIFQGNATNNVATAAILASAMQSTPTLGWTLATANSGADLIATAKVTAPQNVTGIAGSRISGVASALNTIMAADTTGAIRKKINAAKNAEELQKLFATYDASAQASVASTVGAIVSQASANMATRMASGAGQMLATADAGVQAGTAVAAGNEVMGARGVEVWGRVLGGTAEQSKMDSYFGYRSNTYGFTLGGDGMIMDGLKAGIAFTYGMSDVKEKLDASKSDMKSYMLSVYGSYSPNMTWFVDGAFGGGSVKNKGRRFSLLGSRYNTDFGGNNYNGMLSAGYNMKAGDGFVITPFATVAGSATKFEQYTETAADGGNSPLTVPSQTISSFQAGVGAKFAIASKMSDGWSIAPQLSLSYMHEFNGKARTVNVTAAGFTTAIPVKSAKLGTEIFDAGLGVTMKSDQGVSIGVNYNATMKTSYVGHTGMVKVGYKF